MTIEQLNNFLKVSQPLFPLFVFITGASGSGKTFLAQALQEKIDPQYVKIAFFDRVGVPSVEEMVEKWGSGEKWQESMTHYWVQQLASEKDKKVLILEGQFNPEFADKACRDMNIKNYLFVVLHADRPVRDYRLIHQRTQPELANDTMENWAQFLKSKVQTLAGKVIVTSESALQSILDQVTELIKNNL